MPGKANGKYGFNVTFSCYIFLMTTLVVKRACQAKDPSKCRHHGMPLSKLEAKLSKCKTSEEYLHIKNLINAQKTKTYLDSLPKQELTTEFKQEDLTAQQNDSKQDRFDGSEWTDFWVNDVNGEAIGFIKLHVHKTDTGEIERVAVCDVETNPKFRGNNAALALFRKMKTHFNVDHLETGGTFSEKGHNMFLKLRGHEQLTGETTLKLDKWTAPKEHEIAGHNSHSFVKDWENKIPKFRL